MPVEIKELVIRAVVDKGENASVAKREKTSAGMNETEVIDECVRQVLKIMRKEKER
ncbi:MAG: hypothetical protein HRU20_13060 [Pseudomonadales bacterium]|nr:hypothetical protein [Pseudomonadales bacterium]